MEAENEQNKNPIRMATNHYTHSSSSEASVLRKHIFGLRFDIKLQAKYFIFVDFNKNSFCSDYPRDLHFIS